jgi:uncharacterized protein (TIGR02268 family)
MPVPALSTPCLLAMLLASTPVVAWSASTTWEAPEVRRLAPTQDAPGQVHEVRIGPGLSINLFFDARLNRDEMDLEGRERFQRVVLSEEMLTLLPSRAMLPGEVFSLTVRYADGAEPASARFRLVVVPPAEAEFQVDVFRHPLPVSFFQHKEQEARAETRQCLAALGRARAEGGGLADLILAGQVDEKGISGRIIVDLLTEQGPLVLSNAVSYRVGRVRTEAGAPRVRVLLLLKLELQDADARPWRAASAEWVGPSGARWRGEVTQREPLRPGWRSGLLVVEAELPEAEVEGVFSLTLEESGGVRRVILVGVMFPSSQSESEGE